MKGDFTRNTFDPNKRYSQVLMQQGRVQLDADWNEQSAIMLNQLRSFITDLVGPSWAVKDGFDVGIADDAKNDLSIAAGRFYVDGIACDNPAPLRYSAQPGIGDSQLKWNTKNFYLVYLDAWEQLVTHVEDSSIREIALGGADTAVRTQVMWQVQLAPVDPIGVVTNMCELGRALLAKALERSGPPALSAWALKDESDDHCAVNPDAAYRGPENQLYRVEIHDGGTVKDGKPTFKWSRENGSVIFPLAEALAGLGTGTVTARLAHLGRDAELGLTEGDWVELVDDVLVSSGGHQPLLRVTAIDPEQQVLTLSGISVVSTAPARYAFLRRWDQRRNVGDSGVLAVKEKGSAGGDALTLENGVTIQFQEGGEYRSGDYWLIPARTASGDVEWPPKVGGVAPALAPMGVQHHYALLGILSPPSGTGPKKWTLANCRCALPAGFPSCPP